MAAITRRFLGEALALVALSGCATATPPPPAQQPVANAPRDAALPRATDITTSSIPFDPGAFLAGFKQATETADLAAVRNLYADGVQLRWATDGRVRYRSVDAITAALSELRDQAIRLETEYSDTAHERVADDVAVLTTAFRTSGHTADGASFTFEGQVTMVLRLEPDGVWRILHGHTSTPSGPPLR